jgi:hypothetical protein
MRMTKILTMPVMTVPHPMKGRQQQTRRTL